MTGIKIEKLSFKEAKELGIDSWNRWECLPSSFEWEYPEEETAYIFEGEVIVTIDNEAHHLHENMLVTFSKGLKCHWEVKEKIVKAYTFNFY